MVEGKEPQSSVLDRIQEIKENIREKVILGEYFSTLSTQQNCKLLESKDHVFLYHSLSQHSVELR